MKLTHHQKIGLMLVGGVAAVAGGVALLVSANGSTPKPAEKLQPGPPDPSDPNSPTPPPNTKQSYHTTYRGVTALVGTNINDEWIVIYSIDGIQSAIGPVRTNESGILERFNREVDKHYARVRWYPIANGESFSMVGGNVYRVSVSADLWNTFAWPLLAGGVVSFNDLPPDWPATDRDDPTRMRAWFRIPSASTQINVPAIAGLLAWQEGFVESQS